MAGGPGPLNGIRFGVLTCSATRTVANDAGGDVLVAGITAAGGGVTARQIVPDDRSRIAAVLRGWCERGDCQVVLTTGGTGLGPYDLTPDATLDVAERTIPGIAEWLRLKGLEQTPFAALSRAQAALCRGVLIVNLPGSPRGARAGLDALLPILSHAVAIIGGAGHAGPSHLG